MKALNYRFAIKYEQSPEKSIKTTFFFNFKYAFNFAENFSTLYVEGNFAPSEKSSNFLYKIPSMFVYIQQSNWRLYTSQNSANIELKKPSTMGNK